jgi:hypothetical protein
MNHAIENYSWGIIQDMIERDINSAFKLREPLQMPPKKEIKQIIKQTIQNAKTFPDTMGTD